MKSENNHHPAQNFTIAVSGKGGVGKTTVAALLTARLSSGGRKPVLAVDADPNSCLDTALGVKVENTVGSVREETRKLASRRETTGIGKQELLELRIEESLVEHEDFDLIAMGRPEGPGCYCYANNVLGQVIRRIADHYPYLVLDNEAGLENLSRRIVKEIDLFVLVTDPSQQGLKTAARLFELAEEMDIRYKKLALVVNRLRSKQPEAVNGLYSRVKADYLCRLPSDDRLAVFAEEGRSLCGLPETNPVVNGIDRLLDEVIKTSVTV